MAILAYTTFLLDVPTEGATHTFCQMEDERGVKVDPDGPFGIVVEGVTYGLITSATKGDIITIASVNGLEWFIVSMQGGWIFS